MLEVLLKQDVASQTYSLPLPLREHHGADEWADLESLQQITEIYAHTALQFLL